SSDLHPPSVLGEHLARVGARGQGVGHDRGSGAGLVGLGHDNGLWLAEPVSLGDHVRDVYAHQIPPRGPPARRRGRRQRTRVSSAVSRPSESSSHPVTRSYPQRAMTLSIPIGVWAGKGTTPRRMSSVRRTARRIVHSIPSITSRYS